MAPWKPRLDSCFCLLDCHVCLARCTRAFILTPNTASLQPLLPKSQRLCFARSNGPHLSSIIIVPLIFSPWIPFSSWHLDTMLFWNFLSFFKLFIYLIVLGLSCGTRDLRLWRVSFPLVVARGFQSVRTQLLPCSMWDLGSSNTDDPWIPASLAWEGRFLTSGPHQGSLCSWLIPTSLSSTFQFSLLVPLPQLGL